MASKLKGKLVKDYTFGESLTIFDNNIEVISALKGDKIPVSIYAIHREKIDLKTFPSFNNQIAENQQRIFPIYYENVQSQNFLYLIFEQLIHPRGSNPQKMYYEIQRLLLSSPLKLTKKEVFEKKNSNGELCIVPMYSATVGTSSNIYSKFHNKSMLCQLFLDCVHCHNKKQLESLILSNIEVPNSWKNVERILHAEKYQQLPKRPNPTMSRGAKQSSPLQTAMFANKSLIKEAESEYPDIDDEEFEQLMAEVRVNPSLKDEAGQAFMRQSTRARHEETSSKQISSIFENMKESTFKIKNEKEKGKKSKIEMMLNEKKQEQNSFQVYFEAYMQIFPLFKKTIRSFLQKYHNGFAGIIAAYLLTLIGIIKRLQLYKDLSLGIDVFDIGGSVPSMNFSRQMDQIKRELVKEAKVLVNLKSVIQNANMPMKTYEALLPYLEEDIQLVDPTQLKNFCFFYFTVLMKMQKKKSYHEILVLETMYVLISDDYGIVFSEQDLPKGWDQGYYDLKKALIYASVPQWEV